MFSRKIFSLVLVLCIIFLNAICLASCTHAPETPEELWAKVDSAMSGLDSYEINSKLDMNAYVRYQKFKCEIVAKDILIGINSGEFYYYGKASTKSESVALGIDEKADVINAFVDGKYLISTESEDIYQNIFSEMTDEQAREYVKSHMISSDVANCDNVEMSANEDKTYTLVCSGFKKEDVDSFAESVGIDVALFNMKIKDFKETITVDKNFRVKSVTVDFVFDTSNGDTYLPTVTFTSEYSNYGSANENAQAPDFSKSKRVQDIRMLDTLYDMMSERKNSNAGAFKLRVVQTVEAGGKSEDKKEAYTVKYGENADGFFYDVNVSSDKIYNLYYKDGKQIVSYRNQESSTAQSESEAREFIRELMDSINYDMVYVSDVEMSEEGVYKVICENLPKSVSDSIVSSTGGSAKSASSEIIFNVSEGKINNVEEKMTIEIERNVSGVLVPIVYTISMELIFE